MNVLVLDAGALVAIDRNDRDVHRQIQDAKLTGNELRTNAIVVAQVWRDSKGRQTSLARVLRGVRVQPVSQEDGRKAGELLAAAGLGDAIDATVALLAGPGDRILTSDPHDLRRLCEAAGNKALVIRC